MKTPIIVYTVTHPLSTWEVSAIIAREFPRPCVVRQIRAIPPDRVAFQQMLDRKFRRRSRRRRR